MGGFKLLGIRPLRGCSSHFRKNLKEDVIYKFYQDYHFLDEKGKEIIQFGEHVNSNVFNVNPPIEPLQLYSSNENLKINISAIVGKNGSGKSTIIELFFLAVFLCDYKNIILHKKSTEESWISIDLDNSYNQILENNYTLLQEFADGRAIRFFKSIRFFKEERAHIEVYYECDRTIFKLIIDTNRENEIDWYQLEQVINNKFEPVEIPRVLPFYSIALNYSIHSLNTMDLEVWLESIFHKNDAYQTPLVINPKRDEGSIDINNERDLQKSRLLVNTLDIIGNSNNNDPLFNEKRINKVVFKYRLSNHKTRIKGTESLDLNITLINSPYDNVSEEVKYNIERIQNVFDLKDFSSCSWIEQRAYGYLDYKINRILNHYANIFNEEKIEDNFKKMLDYDSHITYKLTQTINFINNSNYIKSECEKYTPERIKGMYGNGLDGYAFYNDPNISIEIPNEKNRLIDDIYTSQSEDLADQIKYLPPPLFDYDFHFSEEDNDTFEKLSSGEKQQIYSIHTIMYHLRNVSSVKQTNELKKYHKINILLDEIELYFHPEMQRHFINRLIKGINQLTKYFEKNIDSINILIATHSPFILSDIPSSNILRLTNGNIKNVQDQTFGANIHDLLANDFFLENGFMGEFAKNEINKVIDSLNYERLYNLMNEKQKLLGPSLNDKETKNIRNEINKINNQLKKLPKPSKKYNEEYCKKLIELVGEPLLYISLMELYAEASQSTKDSFIQSQIDRLQKLKR